MSDKIQNRPEKSSDSKEKAGFRKPEPAHLLKQPPGEVGGPKGPEPTRYGDWERNGIVSDF